MNGRGRKLRKEAVGALMAEVRALEKSSPMGKGGFLARSALAQAGRWMAFCEGRQEDVVSFLGEAKSLLRIEFHGCLSRQCNFDAASIKLRKENPMRPSEDGRGWVCPVCGYTLNGIHAAAVGIYPLVVASE